MNNNRIITFVIHPFLTALLLAVLSTAVLFIGDSNEAPVSLSPEDRLNMFGFVSLFMVYPVFIMAFAVPSLIMRVFDISLFIRAIVFFSLATLCMIIQTPISDYGFVYLVVSLVFVEIDYMIFKKSKHRDE